MMTQSSLSSGDRISDDALSIYERGLERFRAEDYGGAIKDLEKAVELGIEVPDLYLSLGYLYADQGDRERAVASFDRFFELVPLDQVGPERYAAYAHVYSDRAWARGLFFDGWDAAIADYTQAVALDPNFAEAHRERGRLYALKHEWGKVVTDCTRAIELEPTKVQAYELRGWAYSELGKKLESVRDFDFAISLDPDCIFPYMDRGYLRSKFTSDPEALDLLELGAWKDETIAPDSGFPEELGGQTVQHVQRVVSGEDWRPHLEKAQRQGFAPNTSRLKSFCSQCWQEIVSHRRYQVPAAGRASVLASENLRKLVGLHSVQFIQEGIAPPGVFLKFQFSEGASVGIVRIRRHGHVDGWHIRVKNSLFESIVNAIALSYYRDLVTPGPTYEYVSGAGAPRIRSISEPRPLPRRQSISVKSASPRRNRARTTGRRHYHLGDWYNAQERYRHYVAGHLRRVHSGYVAPQEKQLQAVACTGRRLPVGYTWVVEHQRGGHSVGDLGLQDGQLPDYAIFLPPERASQELSQLLGV